MLQDIQHLYDLKLSATDGDLGQVKDFYFDDQSWKIRYLVVDTGNWLPGRQVLLSPDAFNPAAFGALNAKPGHLHVNLTRRQIEDSPSIETHLPISRQHETGYYQYYGWPVYWDAGLLDVARPPTNAPEGMAERNLRHGQQQQGDLHLRSTKAITGYDIHASDGLMGTVNNFLIDGKSWRIREITAETGHWFTIRTIHIPTAQITGIGYDESAVFVDLSIAELESAAAEDATYSAR